MPYGLYLSAAGAEVQRQRLDVLSNNLANVGTTGFKRELAVLQARAAEAVEQGTAHPGAGRLEDLGGGVFVRGTQTDFSQGLMEKTGNPTDLAIDGEGFFQVEGDGGPLLTRAGDFTIDAIGRLVTQNGRPVLSEGGGPIVLDNRFPFEVTAGGMVRQNDNAIPLSLVKPGSLADLAKAGENLFRPLDNVTPLAPGERQVRQFALERSGVKPTTEMVQLIETTRAYETNIRMIQHQDEMTSQLLSRVLRA
ncbi:MAG: flagellar basal-body rod protein FlgF [Planctomycetes bacterium]|nr:flagellar basal-body rod protein FlgF [Planctomycetota bacterium]